MDARDYQWQMLKHYADASSAVVDRQDKLFTAATAIVVVIVTLTTTDNSPLSRASAAGLIVLLAVWVCWQAWITASVNERHRALAVQYQHDLELAPPGPAPFR